MNILDENISVGQREQLQKWGIRVRHIGWDAGSAGDDDDQIVPLLRRLTRPTLFTRDDDFYDRRLCHAKYALVYLAVEPAEAAYFVRRLLRHPSFNTEAKRLGSVIRVSSAGLSYWRLAAKAEVRLGWLRLLR